MSVETEDDVAGFTTLTDEPIVRFRVGGSALGEAVDVDRDGSVDGEDVVKAVADTWGCKSRPAGDGVVDAGDGEASVPAVKCAGQAWDCGDA